QLGLVDAIIPEPVGGAHRNVHDTVYNVESYISQTLSQLQKLSTRELLETRYRKWRSVGKDCTVSVGGASALRMPIVSTNGPTGVRRVSSAARV
ncbi:MAG: hypothetical protein KBI32_14435, partial [Phycisphaerae bacterium]|nr:hypothetical protein [Phycisphaerae bacterium]